MKFLVTGYLPRDFDPSSITPDVARRIHEFNAELEAAGTLVFAGGLASPKTVSAQSDGQVLVTDGPYMETKEQLGGFYILEAGSEDEALNWVKKGAPIAFGPIEVRQIFSSEG